MSEIWRRGAEHENAIGNASYSMLCGNMRQWIMFGVDGQPDVRVRDLEFSTTGGHQPLTIYWPSGFRSTVAEARAILAALPAERLTDRTNPQNGNEGRGTPTAIYQVVGHVQQHVGQIILLTKQMAATDLDLSMPRAALIGPVSKAKSCFVPAHVLYKRNKSSLSVSAGDSSECLRTRQWSLVPRRYPQLSSPPDSAPHSLPKLKSAGSLWWARVCLSALVPFPSAPRYRPPSFCELRFEINLATCAMRGSRSCRRC